MVLKQNSFALTDLKGRMDLMVNNNVLTGRVYASEGTALVPAQAVKQVDVAGGVPVLTAATADTDDIVGFINYNQKDATFKAGMPVEFSAMRGDVMVMEAGAAFAANAQLMVVIAGQQVVTATSGKRIIGRALDKAVNAGDLVRVVIDLPGSLA